MDRYIGFLIFVNAIAFSWLAVGRFRLRIGVPEFSSVIGLLSISLAVFSVRRGCPTASLSPSCANISIIFPLTGAEISIDALSASTDARSVPSGTSSPTSLYILVIVTVSSEGLDPIALINNVPSFCDLLCSQ